MTYPYFSHNGEVLPSEQAVIPLSRLEYAYGFGVYELIRVNKSRALFAEEHCRRLLESAKIIGLEHTFTSSMVKQSVAEVVQKNQAEACNVKILLIGGPSSREASLEIICLSPLFPDRSLYKSGAKVITYKYEREYPAAKTLNMLSSYLAFRQAKLAGAYDALLVNRKGCVTEGTRANFFGLKGCTIMSPPPNEILTGVTRVNMLRVARQEGFEIIEQDIPLSSLDQFDSLFLTSTSSKILPLCQVDETVLGAISPALQELIRSFDQFLSQIADN